MLKNSILIAIAAIFLISCKNESMENKVKEQEKTAVTYRSFGAEISSEGALTKQEMFANYKNLKEGDTLNVAFASSINEVCKKKGCWMNLDLGNESESFVKFKDYGFFMPLNSDRREVIVSGKAFVEIVSVDQLKHFASDAGKSQEDIDAITAPKYTYAFIADGVLMKE